ncbi:MAG: histone deacetylase family protein [Candidatus Lokiarchaeota archaeon]
MKLIYHEKYLNSSYSLDPAAASGRIESIMESISKKMDENTYEILNPESATEDDILLAHTQYHLKYVKNDSLLYELASLAVGGAILTAKQAIQGNPSFGIIRPPGHHASANSAWGFCYFNNMAISLLKLFKEQKIKSAFILDFDLHVGDGNKNILLSRTDNFKVKILNPRSSNNTSYINEVEGYMKNLENIDIFAASAGFDQGIDDWGHLLYPEDYTTLGKLMKKYSQKLCEGKRFALLEGGYNHSVLGNNVVSFLQGFK